MTPGTIVPQIRELTDDADLDRAMEVFFTALVGMRVPAELAARDFVERGRPLGAFVGEELVGTAGSWTSLLTVPGGRRVPHAAVTDVGVLPTHTRRGIAGALMGAQFAQFAARGEAIATLRASEATIYERFGYGLASRALGAEVMVDRAALRPTVPTGGPFRLVPLADSWDLQARIYAASTAGVGMIDRPDHWWRVQRQVADGGPEPVRVVVHGEPGAEDGYVRYRPEGAGWLSGDDRAVMVLDLVAAGQGARLGLLRFVLSIDLVRRVVLPALPVDHGLTALLLDDRALRTTRIEDETWLRLVDVPQALAARTYSGPGAVTIGVTDGVLPANTGVYRVSGTGIERSTAAADLMMDVGSLACVYLGGTRWWQLGDAGRVDERTPGALAAAEELFATPRAPFAGTLF